MPKILSVKANHCMPAEREVSYFEVEIVKSVGCGRFLSSLKLSVASCIFFWLTRAKSSQNNCHRGL